MLNQLNLMNRFDICFHCESSLTGEFSCVDDDVSSGWIEYDPRRAPDSLLLLPYQQFKQLLSFHQQCIANLFSFYPLDLSIDRNNNWYEECVSDTRAKFTGSEHHGQSRGAIHNSG